MACIKRRVRLLPCQAGSNVATLGFRRRISVNSIFKLRKAIPQQNKTKNCTSSKPCLLPCQAGSNLVRLKQHLVLDFEF